LVVSTNWSLVPARMTLQTEPVVVSNLRVRTPLDITHPLALEVLIVIAAPVAVPVKPTLCAPEVLLGMFNVAL